MSAQEIDRYLAATEEPKRATLQTVRERIRRSIPNAQEGISYGMPAFRLNGKVVAGFAAFKDHLTYVPHSGSTLAAVEDDLHGYERTKSALHFAVDKPLPAGLIKKLVAARLKEIPTQHDEAVSVRAKRNEGSKARSAGHSAATEVDAIIAKSADWKGSTLARLRTLVVAADPDAIEEVKWKKPSKPEGVPVWSDHGIICIGEMLKNAVRLTFPKGAQLKDPRGLFNARLESKTIRAVDIGQDTSIPDAAVRALVRDAARVNKSPVSPVGR